MVRYMTSAVVIVPPSTVRFIPAGEASFSWISPIRSTSLSCISAGARTRVPLTNVPFAEPRSAISTRSPRRCTETWFRETNSSVVNGGPS